MNALADPPTARDCCGVPRVGPAGVQGAEQPAQVSTTNPPTGTAPSKEGGGPSFCETIAGSLPLVQQTLVQPLGTELNVTSVSGANSLPCLTSVWRSRLRARPASGAGHPRLRRGRPTPERGAQKSEKMPAT